MRANFFFLLSLGIQLFFFLNFLCFLFFVSLKTVSDNFKNYTPNNGGAVTMCKYAGVFIIGMRLLNYYAQTKGNFETKKIFSFVGAVVWGLCGKFQTLLSLCLPTTCFRQTNCILCRRHHLGHMGRRQSPIQLRQFSTPSRFYCWIHTSIFHDER